MTRELDDQKIGPALRAEIVEVDAQLREILDRPTTWQWVLHGDTSLFRSQVALSYLALGQPKKAKRFALCGTGDRFLEKGQQHCVAVKRCGSPLCPRCARVTGGKFALRAMDHLRVGEHGFVHHVVLTQRALVGEPLTDAIVRLNASWKAVAGHWLKKKLTGGVLVMHIKWTRHESWHVHFHLIGDFRDAIDAMVLLDRWRLHVGLQQRADVQTYLRLLAGPFDAVSGIPIDQSDFWREGTTEVVKALQYALRDVVEGPDPQSLADLTVEAFEEMVTVMKGPKLHRMLGTWRKKALVPESEDRDEAMAKADTTPAGGKWMLVGRCDEVLRAARQGEPYARIFLARVAEATGCSHARQHQRLRTAIRAVTTNVHS